MIKKIVECMSGGFDDPDRFTHTINFDNCALKFDKEGNVVETGPKEYWYHSYNKRYFDSYYKWTKDKSRKYNAWLNRCEKYADSGGLTPGEWEHFEKRC